MRCVSGRPTLGFGAAAGQFVRSRRRSPGGRRLRTLYAGSTFQRPEGSGMALPPEPRNGIARVARVTPIPESGQGGEADGCTSTRGRWARCDGTGTNSDDGRSLVAGPQTATVEIHPPSRFIHPMRVYKRNAGESSGSPDFPARGARLRRKRRASTCPGALQRFLSLHRRDESGSGGTEAAGRGTRR